MLSLMYLDDFISGYYDRTNKCYIQIDRRWFLVTHALESILLDTGINCWQTNYKHEYYYDKIKQAKQDMHDELLRRMYAPDETDLRAC